VAERYPVKEVIHAVHKQAVRVIKRVNPVYQWLMERGI
jgi:hypothetical protein